MREHASEFSGRAAFNMIPPLPIKVSVLKLSRGIRVWHRAWYKGMMGSCIKGLAEKSEGMATGLTSVSEGDMEGYRYRLSRKSQRRAEALPLLPTLAPPPHPMPTEGQQNQLE